MESLVQYTTDQFNKIWDLRGNLSKYLNGNCGEDKEV